MVSFDVCDEVWCGDVISLVISSIFLFFYIYTSISAHRGESFWGTLHYSPFNDPSNNNNDNDGNSLRTVV